MTEEVFIPKFGQTVEEVTLIKWLVEDGAKVAQGQEVLDVETDKAIFSVEATADGYIHVGPYKEGEVLPVVTVVAVIGEAGEKFELKGAERRVERAAAAASLETAETIPVKPQGREGSKVFASPRAQRLAREMKINLSRVTPTGGGGRRITEKDVIAFVSRLPKATPVAQRMAKETGIGLHGLTGTGPQGKITKSDVENVIWRAPASEHKPTTVPFQTLSEENVLERIPLKGVRTLIADRMAMSVHTTARVTLEMEVDATELVLIREGLKERVSEIWGFTPGYNDLLGKMVANALRKFPYMNARMTDDAIVVLSSVNIGMATDTERGLLVPVIQNADQKSLRQFGTEFRRLVEQARQGNISPDDLTGGTFTISNLGLYDVDYFTPIINLPEAAILGVGRIAQKVVPVDGEILIREMCTLSLAFDHRIVDGAPAARFLQYIKTLIEDPSLWLDEMIE